jgi:pimeloyl-ACP methyl ester carboxylesterase
MPFVKTRGLNIHYELAGEGDTVIVFLHGYCASWRWWQPVLKQLPPDYRAYAPELRGCGDTEHPHDGYTIKRLAADLHQFATRLKLPPFHLVGHSLGGAAALQFVIDHPEHVQTLTLVAPAPAEGMSIFYPEKTSLPPPLHLFGLRRDSSLELFDTTYRFLRSIDANRRVMRRAFRRMLPKLADDHFFTALVDDAARMAPEAMVGYVKAVDQWNVEADLAHVHLPVIILWGDRDTVIPDSAPLKRMAKALQGRLVIWKNLGHAPQLEQPKRFMRFVTRFIEQHPTVARPAAQNWLNLQNRLGQTLRHFFGRLHGLAGHKTANR